MFGNHIHPASIERSRLKCIKQFEIGGEEAIERFIAPENKIDFVATTMGSRNLPKDVQNTFEACVDPDTIMWPFREVLLFEAAEED
jgi:hypothetical protein